MVTRDRLQTLDEFIDDLSAAGHPPHDSPQDSPRDSSQQITLTVRTVAGDAVLGPELVWRGTRVRDLKSRLKEMRPDRIVRLLQDQVELGDADVAWDRAGSGTLELTLVYTQEPSEEERQAWIGQLNDGHSLADLPCAAQSDPAVVLAAVRRTSDGMQYASPALRGDRAFMASAARLCGDVLRHASPEIRRDAVVVMAALQYGVSSLRYADRSLLANRDFMLAAVLLDGLALRYADNALRSDRQVVLAAVENDVDALQYAACDNDREVNRLREKRAAAHQVDMIKLSTRHAMAAGGPSRPSRFEALFEEGKVAFETLSAFWPNAANP